MGLHLCSLRNLSSFYDSLNSSPGILTESDFSLSYSSPCQPKESDLSLACHFQNRSPANPIRCYKCQRFGHVTGRCKHSETCARCSETGHKDDTCTKGYKCINCGDKHASYNKKCRYYKREFDILRVSKDVSFLKLVQFIKKNSWTEGDELCWGHQGSNPVYISMYTDRCVVCWDSA